MTEAPNLNKDVEICCTHVQKFLIVILDNEVFQLWIIYANTQILNSTSDIDFVCICTEIPNYDLHNSL